MDDNKKDNTTPTKVSPYPIDAVLLKVEGQPPIPCRIVRLEDFGIMFKSINHLFRPLEEYKCRFEVPVLYNKVTAVIKIIKTYESVEAYTRRGKKERVMTVEAHFNKLTETEKQAIQNFVLKIGQKKL